MRFIEGTESAICRSSEEKDVALKDLLSRERYVRASEDVVLSASQELVAESQEVVKQVCTLLGPVNSDEQELFDSLWSGVVDKAKAGYSASKAVDLFWSHLNNKLLNKQRYVFENRFLILEEGIDRFELGPVAIASGSAIKAHLDNLNRGGALSVEIGVPGMNFSGGHSTVTVFCNNWDITLSAAKQNLVEEATWLAGIAVSLLRLVAQQTLGPHAARADDVEPRPFEVAVQFDNAITIRESDFSCGGWSMPMQCKITKDTISVCGTSDSVAMSRNIFAPPKGSVGARVRQCLGWLARGRQSEDRAERLLYFFTALESLLSNDDRSSPVVQTIARHASVILEEDNDARRKGAKLIRHLYAARSALLHAGIRSVTKSDARQMEFFAHAACWRVLDRVDMLESFDVFQSRLADCSYGLPWESGGKNWLSSVKGRGMFVTKNTTIQKSDFQVRNKMTD